MSFITIYHGTTLEKAKKIIAEKAIRVTTRLISRYPNTTEGYVYVTKRLCDALDFSTRPLENQKITFFVVFKILIDESELIIDEDERYWASTLSEGGENDCFKIKRDLLFGNDVKSVYFKKVSSSFEVGEYMQKVQYGEEIIKESEWKDVCQL